MPASPRSISARLPTVGRQDGDALALASVVWRPLLEADWSSQSGERPYKAGAPVYFGLVLRAFYD